MKVFFLADTHFGVKNDDGLYLQDFKDYYEKDFIPLVRREYQKGDILVHCGDVFDNRARVGLNTLTVVIELFEELATIFDDIRIIVGNHDIYNKNSNEVNSIKMLKHIPNVKIYETSSIEEVAGKKILFNPWIEDVNEQKNLLANSNVDYVFGHLNINGAQNAKVGMCTKIEGAIDDSDFKKAKVYAGHIHIRQKFKNVTYIGAPYQITRNEMGNKKGVTVLDLETGKTKFYENNFSPEFVSCDIKDILYETVGNLKESWKNNKIDLHISSKYISGVKLDEMTNELTGIVKEINVKVDMEQDNSVETGSSDDTGESEDVKGSNDYMLDYLKKMDLDDSLYSKVNDEIDKIMARV